MIQNPVKYDHRVRSYGLQLLVLLAAAIAGSVLYWQAGSAAPGAQSVSSGGSLPVAKGTSAAPISFKNTIAPIFTAHCMECHLGGQTAGGLQLDTYAGLVHGGNVVQGPIFAAGDHAHSVLWRIIQPGGNWPGGSRMPLSGPPYLPAAQIQVIADWIDQGARNN